MNSFVILHLPLLMRDSQLGMDQSIGIFQTLLELGSIFTNRHLRVASCPIHQINWKPSLSSKHHKERCVASGCLHTRVVCHVYLPNLVFPVEDWGVLGLLWPACVAVYNSIFPQGHHIEHGMERSQSFAH